MSNENKNDVIDDYFNLLLNMSGGLLPEHLTEQDVKIIEDRFTKENKPDADWFTELGYTEPEYKRSKYDKHNTQN